MEQNLRKVNLGAIVRDLITHAFFLLPVNKENLVSRSLILLYYDFTKHKNFFSFSKDKNNQFYI